MKRSYQKPIHRKTKQGVRRGSAVPQDAVQLTLDRSEVLQEMQEGLHRLGVSLGLELAALMMEDEVEQLHRSMLVKQLLGYMGEDCRDLLRFHYLEGRTANELAGLFGTTEGYAKKLIHKCLVRVRELYGKLRSTT